MGKFVSIGKALEGPRTCSFRERLVFEWSRYRPVGDVGEMADGFAGYVASCGHGDEGGAKYAAEHPEDVCEALAAGFIDGDRLKRLASDNDGHGLMDCIGEGVGLYRNRLAFIENIDAAIASATLTVAERLGRKSVDVDELRKRAVDSWKRFDDMADIVQELLDCDGIWHGVDDSRAVVEVRRDGREGVCHVIYITEHEGSDVPAAVASPYDHLCAEKGDGAGYDLYIRRL